MPVGQFLVGATRGDEGCKRMASGFREVDGLGLDRALGGGSIAGLSEGELLGRFVARRDQAAFEALIARHGPMVLGVCRRMLGDPHAAADAFQATFLVLVRKAGSLRDADRLGPWLHGVACKVAARSRADAARRREREARRARPEAWEEAAPLDGAELRGVLDEELNRLPERYRRPIILCYLEGHTHEEAARRLRCTSGTLRGRLDRGREKLRARLRRRGVAPSVVLTLAEPAAPSVPHALVAVTATSAARALVGGATSTAGLPGALRAASLGKLPLAASVLAVAGGSLLFLPRAAAPGRPQVPDPPGPAAARLLVPSPAAAAPASVPGGVTLTGSVRDRAGRPIPGARVVLGGDRQGNAAPAILADADGRFAIPGVAPGPAVLTVQAAGRSPDLRELDVAPGVPPVEFTLGPGRSIGGRISDLAGKPIAGAPITAGPWRGHNSLAWRTVTDLDGRYRWDDAPEDAVLIDLGTMGYTSKRLLTFPPGQVERDLTMPRPRFARGSVADATTGRPIERFTVLTGHGDAASGYLEWEYTQASTGSGGTYEAKLGADYRSFDRFVRIEAEGYLPERSRPLGEGEAEWDRTVDFRLRPGEGWIAGVVRLADGSPVAGAEVTLVTSVTPIADGRLSVPQRGRKAATDPAGRFRFPPLDSPFAVVVLHDAGFAALTSEEFARGSTMTLRPWGRVEGTYRVGPAPGTGERLALTRGPMGPPFPLIQFSGHATVDREGRFVFERVRDGEVTVGRVVSMGSFASHYPVLEPIQVEPGATARVAIGGTGRPVVGRFDLPARIAEQVDWTWSEILLVPTASSRRVFVGKHTPEGGLRIEDVPAGSYDLIVEIKKAPPGQDAGFSDQPIAAIRRKVQVPEMPGGRSDQPLDVGLVAPPAVNPGDRPPGEGP